MFIMKSKWIVLIILIIALGLVAAYFLFPENWNSKSCIEECQHRGYTDGTCNTPENAVSGFENIGPCISSVEYCQNKGQCNCYCFTKIPLVEGCGGVAPEHIQECCNRWATENRIIIPACVGNWEVREGQCSWICG